MIVIVTIFCIKELISKDDKYGNLYSSNSTISASADSAISSSYNYAGNIFYNSGIVILTETSSHSHTPSTASITVGTLVSPAIPGFNKIFITSSDLTTGITFVSTGSTETDTSTVKYFASASTAAITATSASAKINSVFGGEHISASVSSNTINLTNNANDLVNRITTNKNNNLPRISGSAGFATTKGFGGGVASVEYTHAAASGYSIDFKSTQTIFTHEYLIEIDPGDFNHTMNPTARGFASGSTLTRGTESPFLRPRLTASGWSPYLSGISLYQDGGPYFDHSEYPYKPIIEPVIIAKFPNAIKMRNDMKMIFKLRLDM